MPRQTDLETNYFTFNKFLSYGLLKVFRKVYEYSTRLVEAQRDVFQATALLVDSLLLVVYTQHPHSKKKQS